MGEGGTAGRTIIRGAQANAAGFLVRFAARLIFLFVAGRLYGAGLFGAFVLAAALVELGVSLGSLSTKKTLFPLLERHADSPGRPLAHILIDAALLVTLVSLALAGMLMLGAILLAPPDTAAALIMLAPMIAGQALLDLFLAAARWKQKVRYEVISRSLIEPWFLALGAIAAFYAGFTEHGLIAGYWCGTLAALCYAVRGAAANYPGFDLVRYRPSGAIFRAIGRAASANSATDFLNALYMRVDLYLVGFLLGEGPTGIYGMARQVATPIRQVRQSFDGLLVPAVSRTIALSNAGGTAEALASATRLILVIQLPLLIAMVAIGAPLMAFLGDGFEAAYWVLLILAAAEILQSALGVGDLVFVYRRPRIGLYLTLIGIGAGVAASLMLIPGFGITGAAAGLFAAYALRSVLRILVLHRTFAISLPSAHLAGPLIAAGAAAALILVIPSALFALAAGLAAYALLLWIWLRASGQRLALTGFAAERPAQADFQA